MFYLRLQSCGERVHVDERKTRALRRAEIPWDRLVVSILTCATTFFLREPVGTKDVVLVPNCEVGSKCSTRTF